MPQEKRYYLAPLMMVIGSGILIWWFWTPLTTLLGDLDSLRGLLANLGAWGPPALVALSIVQVLVAPLPGYPIVFVSGLLYGTWWGAIYANIGLLLAGMIAMGLTRRFGRPLAERFVPTERLQRIERLFSSNSVWLWFLILLIPTGDFPYFAAGLSRVTFRNFFIALCLARLPFTFVLTNAAERSTTLPQETIWIVAVFLVVVVSLAYWQQERITNRFERLLERLTPHPLERE